MTMNINSPKHQHGAVLIISLLILITMTVIGISSMQSSTVQEKIVNNMRDKQQATNAADRAAREPESWFGNIEIPAYLSPKCSDAGSACTEDYLVWSKETLDWDNLPDAFWDDSTYGNANNWWDDHFTTFGEASSAAAINDGNDDNNNMDLIPSISFPPEYVVEEYASISNVQEAAPKYNCDEESSFYYYQITTVGYGVNSQAVVRTVYLKKC